MIIYVHPYLIERICFMKNLVTFIICVSIFIISNVYVYKNLDIFISKIYFIFTSLIGAIISSTYCSLILDKYPNLIILIVSILLFQIITICFLVSKLFGYKLLTIVVFISSCYFLIMCAIYFGEYYFRNNLLSLPETLKDKIGSIINNKNYSLRIKIKYLQKYYFYIGIKHFFELPEYSYINYISISQYILGKVFDITVFANIGNYLINKYNHISHRQ